MKYARWIIFLITLICWKIPADAQTRDSSASFKGFQYAITIDTLRHTNDAQRVLVDVRSPEAVERVSIPGAINIPLFAVKTKGFLHTRPIVLIDEGFRPRTLNDACAQLHEAGFEARFLWGGLNAWQNSGETIQGDRLAQRELRIVTAQQLFLEPPADGWVVIDAPSSDTEADEPPFPQTQKLPFSPDKPENFLPELQGHIQQYLTEYSTPPLILLYTQNGAEYANIEKILDEPDLPPIFFLHEGLRAYLSVMTQQRQFGTGPHEVSTECSSCARSDALTQ